MNSIRNRAKDHLPTLLLTLLSIVQALALELLWSYIRESAYLIQFSWASVLSWLQIIATFIGIVLIWFVYASNVMRFRWAPTIGDSIFPFLIGLLEFSLIAALGADFLGWWFIVLAGIFGLVQWSAHLTMRQARLDGENDAHFADLDPAKLKDFTTEITTVIVLFLVGVLFLLTGHQGVFALIAVFATNALLIWQFVDAANFWRLSMGSPNQSDNQSDD